MYDYGDMFRRASTAAQQVGQQAERAYVDHATNFDPYAAAERSSMGQFNLFLPELQRRIQALRGQQVGMGRLNSGFATQDEDRLVTTGIQDLNDRILVNANQAAHLDFQNFTNLGGYGERKMNQGYELAAGQRDAAIARQNAKAQGRSSIFGSLLGAAGTILGSSVGGPMGGSVAGSIGKAIGGLFR